MTPADELTAAAEKLRTARFTGALTATPAVAALIAAREPIAKWLTSWAPIEIREDGPLPEDAALALATARAINGSQP